MPTVTLSIPAQLGGLGIGQGGLKLRHSLIQQGWSVYAIAMSQGNQDQIDRIMPVKVDPIMRIALATPIRLREDWLLNLGYKTFDFLARSRIPKCDVFYGYTQASLWSMRKAAESGALTVLHAANTFLPSLRRVLNAEYERLGMRFPPINRNAVRRVLAEYSRADLIRAQSTLVRDSLVSGGVPASKVVMIPPAVDLDRFKPPAQRSEGFVAAYVGAFSVRKGFHHLLTAWDMLRLNQGRLVLHGGGGRWAQSLVALRRQRSDIVLRHGAPEETYQQASVCIIPSIEDGFCYVALEAMAAGVPIILTDQVGAKDLITDGVDGFIVPAGDPLAIAARIAELATDPHRVASMGVAARRRAERCTFAVEGQRMAAAFRGNSDGQD
jgi:glycosyltransferase involved in cell wall biosynthesis